MRRCRRATTPFASCAARTARFLVVLSQVLYVKRYAREARVGFTQ